MAKKIDEEVNGVYTTPKQRPEEESENGVQAGGASASQTGGTSAVRSSGDPYEVAMNAHHQNGGTQGSGGGGAINSSVLPTGDSGKVGGGSAAVGTGSSAPDGDDDPYPTNAHTRERAFVAEHGEAPSGEPTEEEARKAERKDRRSKRVGIASRLMDTMARMVNFGTAAAGGPAAKWGPMREGAPTTYLARLKEQRANDLANYWNRRDREKQGDTDDYNELLGAWNARQKAKGAAAEGARKDAESAANVALKGAQKDKEDALRDKYKQDAETGKKVGAAQAAHYYASAGAQNRSNNENYYIYTGGDKYKQYGKADKEKWAQDVIATANKMQIPLVDEYQKIVEEEKLHGKTTLTTENKDRTLDRIAAEIQTKIRERETPIE